MKTPITTTGVWLRTGNPDPRYPGLKKLEVLVEIEGQWRVAITSHVPSFEGECSHIAEGLGMQSAPLDPITAPGVEAA